MNSSSSSPASRIQRHVSRAHQPLALDTNSRARAASSATNQELMSPVLTLGRTSSQFRLRRAPTASKEYQNQTPGLEPGIQVDQDHDGLGDERMDQLHTDCQITIVEFSADQIEKYEVFNDGLKEFLETPREDWVKVRWINCNGLSWDVIRLLALHYNFHSLGALCGCGVEALC